VRAIQFLRAHAKEWNLNPKLVAATGGSAGAGMSLWIVPGRPARPVLHCWCLSNILIGRSMLGEHVFLSHASADKRFVRKLADRLRLIGITPWLDELEIKPGASLIGEIERGLQTSSLLFAVMSDNSVKSRWVAEEIRSILTRQITTGRIEVIPIRIDNCEMPPFLSDKKYLDFRRWDEETAFRSAFDNMVEQLGWINAKYCRKTGMKFVRVPAGVFLFGERKVKTYLDEFMIQD
jgi:hypothetical protein